MIDPIVCVGETSARMSRAHCGSGLAQVRSGLAAIGGGRARSANSIVIAYEPVGHRHWPGGDRRGAAAVVAEVIRLPG